MSPAGIALFLECHSRLCQITNELLPYGQTLFSALFHLRHVEAVLIIDDLATLKSSGLLGTRACFVGAPNLLVELAREIIDRIREEVPGSHPAIIAGRLYLVALKRFRIAQTEEVLGAYQSMLNEAGAALKMSKTQRSLRKC
jgi:hypothetical protein